MLNPHDVISRYCGLWEQPAVQYDNGRDDTMSAGSPGKRSQRVNTITKL